VPIPNTIRWAVANSKRQGSPPASSIVGFAADLFMERDGCVASARTANECTVENRITGVEAGCLRGIGKM
jgi:hypothetical protein